MRGEHNLTPFSTGQNTGSSPHARGTPSWHRHPFLSLGIIPACAGNTIHGGFLPCFLGDHPRMRGEHFVDGPRDLAAKGSSPHARGTPGGRRAATHLLGIIPACAGNTVGVCHRRLDRRDHPRMRGEHLGRVDVVRAVAGSSPHARGTLNSDQQLDGFDGIIPACAGNTSARN